MSTANPQATVADLDRAELLWQCYKALLWALAKDAGTGGSAESLNCIAGHARTKMSDLRPKVEDAGARGVLSDKQMRSARNWLGTIQEVESSWSAGGHDLHGLDKRIELLEAAHKVVEEGTRPVMSVLGKWHVPLPKKNGYEALRDGFLAGSVLKWRSEVKEHERCIEEARNKLLVRERQKKERADTRRRSRREGGDWTCPKKTYIAVGPHRVALVVKGEKVPFYVMPRTRAWAILDCLLIERFAKSDVIKRAIVEVTPGAANEPPGRLVGKENRQVFAPRICKYLPHIPKDVIRFNPTHQVYGCLLPIRPLGQDDDDA